MLLIYIVNLIFKTFVDTSDGSNAFKQFEETSFVVANRFDFIKIYKKDDTLVGLRMFDLLNERDVHVGKTIFTFEFGGIITFGAFTWPLLRF